MTSRIDKKFREILSRGGKAFIPYVMTGHPSLGRTRELIGILTDCGADIIELGVPFSDPLADGPTIQRAAQAALEQGITLRKVIGFVASLRESTQIPIILMTYYNLIFKYGEERFSVDASAAGVDGIIVPDLPPDEAGNLIRHCRKHGISTIFLLAPTSTQARIDRVTKASRGFIYYVSMTGITGADLSMDASIESHIAGIRTLCSTPVAVGFGISSPADASAVAKFADGVIVGSAIVKQVTRPDGELRAYLMSLRDAIR